MDAYQTLVWLQQQAATQTAAHTTSEDDAKDIFRNQIIHLFVYVSSVVTGVYALAPASQGDFATTFDRVAIIGLPLATGAMTIAFDRLIVERASLWALRPICKVVFIQTGFHRKVGVEEEEWFTYILPLALIMPLRILWGINAPGLFFRLLLRWQGRRARFQ